MKDTPLKNAFIEWVKYVCQNQQDKKDWRDDRR